MGEEDAVLRGVGGLEACSECCAAPVALCIIGKPAQKIVETKRMQQGNLRVCVRAVVVSFSLIYF